MSHAPAAQENQRRATLYWEQSQSDHGEAKRRRRGGAYVESCHFALQAAINALASVCHLRGHGRPPSHSAVQLLELCKQSEAAFADEALAQACAALETVQDKGPFDAPADPKALRQEATEALRQCELVLKTVKRSRKDITKEINRVR